jgi:hypothetical protein
MTKRSLADTALDAFYGVDSDAGGLDARLLRAAFAALGRPAFEFDGRECVDWAAHEADAPVALAAGGRVVFHDDCVPRFDVEDAAGRVLVSVEVDLGERMHVVHAVRAAVATLIRYLDAPETAAA